MSPLAQRFLGLDDFEPAARRHLPRSVFGYVAGGVEDNQSLHDNRRAFAALALVPRVLVDVSQRSTAVDLLGQRWAAPFGVAPMGLAALWAYRGDLVLAAAARQAGVPFVLSGSSLIALEAVFAQHPEAWFQAYLPGDLQALAALLQRVAAAGCRTLVVTLDTAVAANRQHNVRDGFSIPLRPGPRLAWQGLTHPRWLLGTALRTLLRHGLPHFENARATRGTPILSPQVERNLSDRANVDWAFLRAVRRQWAGHLVVKGVLHAGDAARAVAEGADGVIVSNHGGRQLDGAIAPLQALPAVVAACPGVPVMLDSGVRRGSDVVKALALGARFVFVGRPFAYAAAVAGQAGAQHAMALLQAEVARNLGLLGVTTPGALDATFVQRHGLVG